jgi:hypothetical protein
LVFCSCQKDDDTITPDQDILTGNFEVYMDGSLFSEGTNVEVGRIQDDQGVYVNTVTIGDSDIGITVTGFPKTIGDVTTMEANSDPGISIMFGEDYYGTISGTFTRTSASRITFDGTCTKLLETQEYTITGFVESEAWEIIN